MGTDRHFSEIEPLVPVISTKSQGLIPPSGEEDEWELGASEGESGGYRLVDCVCILCFKLSLFNSDNVDPCAILRDTIEILYILYSFSLNVAALQNYNTVSKSAYWHQYRQDTEHFHPHKEPSCCPFIAILSSHLYPSKKKEKKKLEITQMSFSWWIVKHTCWLSKRQDLEL